MPNLRLSTLCMQVPHLYLDPGLNHRLHYDPCGLLTHTQASDAQWGVSFQEFFNAVGFWSLLSCSGLVEEGDMCSMLSWPLAFGCSSWPHQWGPRDPEE